MFLKKENVEECTLWIDDKIFTKKEINPFPSPLLLSACYLLTGVNTDCCYFSHLADSLIHSDLQKRETTKAQCDKDVLVQH